MGVPPTRLAFAYLAMVLFQYMEFKPYHVKGGSQAISNAILNKFIGNGGTARFSCGAKKIMVGDGQVKGVITDDGDEIAADYVVSNISPIATYNHLMDPENIPQDAAVEMKSRNLSTSAFTMFVYFITTARTSITSSSFRFVFTHL